MHKVNLKLSEFDTYLAGLGKPVESAVIDYPLGCHGGVAHKEDIDFRISYLTKVRERRIMRKIRQGQTV